MGHSAAIAAVIAAASAFAPGARADLIWYADPAKGEANFKKMEITAGTHFSIEDDPAYGKVFHFDRSPGSNRCEAQGAAGYDTKEGDLVYIAMRYRIEAPQDLRVTGIFQWKTYDTPGHPNKLNFPVLIHPNNGKLEVEVRKPGAVIWSIPTPIGKWFHVVLCINQSFDQQKGYVEFWYEGEQQKLSNGQTRYYCQTLDGGYINPKWGIYGTNSSPKPQSGSYICDMRIGTGLKDVLPADLPGGTGIRIRPKASRGSYLSAFPEGAVRFDIAGRAAGDRKAAGAWFIAPARSQPAAVIGPVQ